MILFLFSIYVTLNDDGFISEKKSHDKHIVLEIWRDDGNYRRFPMRHCAIFSLQQQALKYACDETFLHRKLSLMSNVTRVIFKHS